MTGNDIILRFKDLEKIRKEVNRISISKIREKPLNIRGEGEIINRLVHSKEEKQRKTTKEQVGEKIGLG